LEGKGVPRCGAPLRGTAHSDAYAEAWWNATGKFQGKDARINVTWGCEETLRVFRSTLSRGGGGFEKPPNGTKVHSNWALKPQKKKKWTLLGKKERRQGKVSKAPRRWVKKNENVRPWAQGGLRFNISMGDVGAKTESPKLPGVDTPQSH